METKSGPQAKGNAPDQEYEELPHNLGRVRKFFRVSKPTPPGLPAQSKITDGDPIKATSLDGLDLADEFPPSISHLDRHKELPPPSKKVPEPSIARVTRATSARIRKRQNADLETREEVEADQKGEPKDDTEDKTPGKKRRLARKTKDNPYGVTPGKTPFPDWASPSPEACEEVHYLLVGSHGPPVQPRAIPAPSMEVAGCGEVPSVLDALIRTRLSASTTSNNAGMAMKGLRERFGQIEEGIGAGSTDWNQVRIASFEDLRDAINSGGLANVKARDIKRLLDMVYEENTARAEALMREKESGEWSVVAGSESLTQAQKDVVIAKAEQDILSLDHLRGVDKDEVMLQLVKYPGIGVKTAACVILFNMQRPCFAVDTHVWRLSKWLGWVPDNASRDETFSHLEVRVPDHLKYALHQLFIKEGRTCYRCSAMSKIGTARWEASTCPMDHLLSRAGKETVSVKNPEQLPDVVEEEEEEEEAQEGAQDVGLGEVIMGNAIPEIEMQDLSVEA